MAKKDAGSIKGKTIQERLEEVAGSFRRSVMDLQKNPANENALYRLRVTLKKSCAYTEFLNSLSPDDISLELQYAHFKQLQKKIASARDTQVQVRQFTRYRKKYVKVGEPFFHWLTLRKYRKNRSIESSMQNLKLSFYQEIYDELVSVSTAAGEQALHTHASRFIRKELLLCKEHSQRIKTDYHKLRVHIKKIHHVMEILGMLQSELLGRTKPLEKLLGNSQDLQNGKDAIQTFLSRHKLPVSASRNLKKLSAILEKKKKNNLQQAKVKAGPILEAFQKAVENKVKKSIKNE